VTVRRDVMRRARGAFCQRWRRERVDEREVDVDYNKITT
jgi:hypothetical protein